jgi:ribosomal 50S subunit-recycling heat shock protein
MRLDKFLKVSRLIKRRTVAQSACAGARVEVNGRAAKPAYQLKEGDVLTIRFGEKPLVVRVLRLSESVRKEDADAMYEVIP